MAMLIAGLALFLGVHSISIISAPWRDRMVARIGIMPWQGIYSLLSIIGFVLIINGYGMARLDALVLYHPPEWLRYVAIFLLIFIFPLLLATYLPGRIRQVTKHPMLAATKIWAFAHLLANGSLADVILFGAFLTWAIVNRISLKRRMPLPVPDAMTSRFNDVIAVIGGLVLYGIFVLWLHAHLFGVSPLGLAG